MSFKAKRYDPPPPYMAVHSSPPNRVEPSAPAPTINRGNNDKKPKGRRFGSINIFGIFMNKSVKKEKKQPKYHGPVVNEPKEGILKITTTRKNISTGRKRTEVGYIKTINNQYNEGLHNYQGYRVNKDVYINGMDPMPLHLIPTRRITKDEYFREQQRLLLNRQMDERVRFEAQRVYPALTYNCY